MTSSSTSLYMSLHFSRSPTDETSKVPWFPLHCVANNPIARFAFNYSIVDDLDDSPLAMSTMEVLKTCDSQHKALISMLGIVNPYDSRLITLDLD